MWSSTKIYCYEVDYNDHFETPLKAYEDILPLLDLVAPSSRTTSEGEVKSNTTTVSTSSSRADHVLYDPYYCNGRTKTLLKRLDFVSTINEERDFYKDIASNTCPPHHTLVTNPPYSVNHKSQCIQYALQGLRQHHAGMSDSNRIPSSLRPSRPFFLLMPNYVATKSYFKERIANACVVNGKTPQDIVYIIPEVPYEYDHPEGTGHAIPPFDSMWFCGIGKENVERAKQLYNNCTSNRAKIATSLDQLEAMGIISFNNRPNPRKRRNRKQINEKTASTGSTLPDIVNKRKRADNKNEALSVARSLRSHKKNANKKEDNKVLQATAMTKTYDYDVNDKVVKVVDVEPSSNEKEKKQRKISLPSSSSLQPAIDTVNSSFNEQEKVQKKKKSMNTSINSIYRDNNGVRTKRRF